MLLASIRPNQLAVNSTDAQKLNLPHCGCFATALFRKHVPDEEVAEDFPALNERDLAYARLAARLGQPPGRPKKHLRIEWEPGVANLSNRDVVQLGRTLPSRWLSRTSTADQFGSGR